jgi:hypothetical protein
MPGLPYTGNGVPALDCVIATPDLRGRELTKHSSRATDAALDDRPAKRARPDDPPASERRSSYRVRDEQQSGHGSLTALSKMKMLERKRAAIRPARDEPPRILD